MTLSEKIAEDLKKAIKSRNKTAVEALRLIKSEIGYKKIEKGDELDEKELNALLSSMSKKWREAIDQFKKAGRDDLVEQETAKLEILIGYLPEQLTEEEISGIIDEIITELGVTSKAGFGKAMKAVMERVRGQADGSVVKDILTAKLS